MKILLLNQTFYPDVVSTAQHLSDLALALTERGHDVTVIASRRAYDDPSKRFPRQEEWCGIDIRRVRTTGFGKGAKWRRAVDFASFIVMCIWKLLWIPRQDAVVALTSPPLISFLGAVLARVTGAKFYYWVMDLNPDEAIVAGWLKEDSLPAAALQWMSRYSFKRSEKIIALDRFMQTRIVAKGIAPAKIAVLPPWSHDEAVRFDEFGREEFRRRHGLVDKFVVMYSGNHSPCHPLDTLLAAAKELRGEDQFRFLFVGGGSEFVKVKHFASANGLANILCLPYQPLTQLAGSLSAADLHVVVMGTEFVGTIHPCKIYNILAVGAPVFYLGPDPSHVTEILAELRDVGHCYQARHGDLEAVTGQLRAAAAAGTRMDAAGVAAVAGRYSHSTLLPKLADFFED